MTIVTLRSHLGKAILFFFVLSLSSMPTVVQAAQCVDGTCG